MGGCRCSYKNCKNTTKTRENLHFFHYPVKQKERCKHWIENAEKPHFYHLDEVQLRNKVICETHFEDCYFLNSQKKRLLQGAIPTLDGDCEPKENERSMKDVQVLPANADGTIFVLETNTQNNFQSEKVESYIYTNNGLVLPINKCTENTVDSISSVFSEEEEMQDSRQETVAYSFNESAANRIERDFDIYIEPETPALETRKFESRKEQAKEEIQSEPLNENTKSSEEIFPKCVANKYVKKIKQHSKDIALLKRMLKTKNITKKPTNRTILNTLKKQIPQTLHSLLNFNLHDSNLSQEDFDFFSTIYTTSPQLYKIFIEKYKWKLPNPEIFINLTNKNNGHVHSDNN